MPFIKPLLILLISFGISSVSRGQILFQMHEYRNLAYSSTGYNGAFENYTIGVARRDYIKLIKREIIGILDVSLPVNKNFFTRHALRKAFQLNLHEVGNFKIPFMFASTSIVRENNYFKFHDVTAEFSLAPGIFKEKYSFAVDIRYELIVFRYKKYKTNYFEEVDPTAKNHWEKPFYSILKVGFMGGLNFRRIAVYFKTGYERNPIPKRHYLPGYALIGLGYKFGTKPIK